MPDTSPIIIIGAARSGTKFLRDTLAVHPGFYSVPFDVNFVWRFQQSVERDDVLSPDCISPIQIKYIRNTLFKMSKKPIDGVLLEKTVSNTLRVPFVQKVFPNARYIHLIRNGTDVTLSSIRQWQEPMDKFRLFKKLMAMPLANASYAGWFMKNWISRAIAKNKVSSYVWGPRYPGITDDLVSLPLATVCAKQWRTSLTVAQNDLSKLDDNRVFEIRYENLVKDKTALEELLKWLSVDDTKPIIDYFEDNVLDGSARPISQQEKQLIHLIQPEIDETLKEFCYARRYEK